MRRQAPKPATLDEILVTIEDLRSFVLKVKAEMPDMQVKGPILSTGKIGDHLSYYRDAKLDIDTEYRQALQEAKHKRDTANQRRYMASIVDSTWTMQECCEALALSCVPDLHQNGRREPPYNPPFDGFGIALSLGIIHEHQPTDTVIADSWFHRRFWLFAGTREEGEAPPYLWVIDRRGPLTQEEKAAIDAERSRLIVTLLVTSAEAAAYLGISVDTFNRRRKDRHIQPAEEYWTSSGHRGYKYRLRDIDYMLPQKRTR